MKEAITHYIKNKPQFDLWIELFSKIPVTHDLLKPLIKPFEQANPGTSIHACSECVIDMLIWYRKESKVEAKK